MAVNINVPSQVKTYANLAAFPATGALKTIYIAEDTNKTYRWTGSVYTEISASAAMTWGAIGGTLSNQTDLQSALNAKENTITAGTTSQYFRGDKTFQTLDKAAVGLGNVDNTSDANKPISTATQTALNAKQDSLGFTPVPTSRTLTINGVTQDLSANRTFTISTGITIGSTAIASGTVGRILFEGAGNVVQESSSLFWDATNNRLGIGTSSPSNPLHLLSATNAAFFAKVQNTNGGSSASAGYEIQSNTAYGSIFATPSAYAPFGVLNASQIGFYSTNTFAIAIDSATSDFRIGTGLGATERMRIFANGNVLINTTTDAGFRLDVNGTARVKGGNNNSLIIDNDGSQYTSALIRHNGNSRMQFTWDSSANSGYIGSFNTSATTLQLRAGIGSTFMILHGTGNVGIGTTTDAGFRLDVNGTGRVQGQLNLGNASTDGFLYSSPSVAMRFGGGQTTNTFIFTQINSGRFQAAGTTEQAHVLMTVGQSESSGQENRGSVIRHTGTVSTSNGNAIFSNFQTNTVINTTGGTTTYRGFYHNPTLTATTGTTHFAFHSTSGLIRFENLPTSAAGLPAGTLYNNLGVLMIA